uniref:Crossover junction endonuclease MUS81 n=1 Tax=Astyanax mexicanus TaxID=7994 RepID=A0A8B9LII3_ASTMX
MPSEPIRVGRKRPLSSCPNPLFLSWLTEMRDHAKEKGQKTQYVYQKAINSLKKYPLPLKNGKEAKILQNFGDGICKILDERLQKYYKENGKACKSLGLRPPVAKELVLDYIIERKRIDDLCGSIMDGRFREQKFRLKRCGLHKPIYLVEECGSAGAHLSLPESTLKQAIVNTQVVDGFFVKRVQDVKESAAYLTVMTRYLQKLYQNCTLFCRSRELEENEEGDLESEATMRENPNCNLISFTEFNCGAVKNKCQTVRDVFARQLMQISGISGDKAAAILEHYSTVSSLLKAYAQCTSEAEGEKLLSSIKYGKLKRNLGPALSRTVYQLYSTRGPLS